ncbi:uncharacterized protein LY89DRAFT_715931 [Mollisia scopiformis]|uniref:Uncharacterized protein n=1 Tax=Mollisia scopiformis TaxID=149040 RepID=A0A194XKB9_MOLSC|nr:uncharacterized protein LY89DRAFT_715931 [Mollisia scopiformis]KUJ20554.1 hypothetical protein LY89DRAFT_715931 [Mollisia scopiformis]
MVPHALDKLWRFDETPNVSQPPAKKAGKPALQWTPSRERKLFRCVAMANVPMKHIATAMYEAAVPAEDGKPEQPEFAPCRSSCRNHWHEMTEMKPKQMLINNLFSREKQRKQMTAAFEAYLERKSKTDSSNEAQVPNTVPSMPKTSYEDTISTTSSQMGTATDMSTPLLIFEGETPIDHGPVFTPKSHDTAQPRIADGAIRPLNWGTGPIGLDSGEMSPAAQITATKRRVPIDFDEVGEASTQKIPKQHLIASVEGEAFQVRTPSGQTTAPDRLSRTGVANKLKPVQEHSDEHNETQLSIFEVEDEMGVPHGFIPWVHSVISATGTMVSRLSSRRSSQRLSVETQSPDEPNPLFRDSHMSSSILFENVGRQDLDLFDELRRDNTTDLDVASRIRHFLGQLSVARARQLVRTRNHRHETALEVALALGNIPACEVLLQFGADVYAKTSNGKSLSAFGRAVGRKDIPTKYYVAIGACRNKIFSKAGEDELKNNPDLQKAKRVSSINNGAWPKSKARARSTTFPKRANTTHVPPPLSSGLARLGSLVGVSRDRLRHSRPNGSRESSRSYGRPVSFQRAPSLAFSDNFWDRISDPRPIQTDRMNSASQESLQLTQSLHSNFVVERGTPVPTLPDFDPSLGVWELLPDNRMVFVPHSQRTMELPILPNPLPHQNPPEAEIRQSTIGLAQFPNPPARIEFRQPSQRNSVNTRRHGMIFDSVAANSIMEPAAATTLNDVLQEYHQPDAVADTINSLPDSDLAFMNAYDNQSYNRQNETTANVWDTLEQIPPNENPTFMNVPEAELANLFPEEILDNNFAPGWI